MSAVLPVVYLVRHGETPWSVTGQHTGLTDLPLTERGQHDAKAIGQRLRSLSVAHVLTSPLRRASRTCVLAGFGEVAEVDPDLVEWDYGQFEGRTTAEIRKDFPNWTVFRDGSPGGESVQQVAARADRVIRRVRAIKGNVLLFSSGHFLRMFAARWLNLPPSAGQSFLLNTTSLSELGYEHALNEPAIRRWNTSCH